MRRIWLVIVFACTGEKPAPADGAAGYAFYCATCHGATGKPDATMVARLGVRDLTAPDMRSRITPALVEQQIRTGSKNKLMPPFEGAMAPETMRDTTRFRVIIK